MSRYSKSVASSSTTASTWWSVRPSNGINVHLSRMWRTMGGAGSASSAPSMATTSGPSMGAKLMRFPGWRSEPAPHHSPPSALGTCGRPWRKRSPSACAATLIATQHNTNFNLSAHAHSRGTARAGVKQGGAEACSVLLDGILQGGVKVLCSGSIVVVIALGGCLIVAAIETHQHKRPCQQRSQGTARQRAHKVESCGRSRCVKHAVRVDGAVQVDLVVDLARVVSGQHAVDAAKRGSQPGHVVVREHLELVANED